MPPPASLRGFSLPVHNPKLICFPDAAPCLAPTASPAHQIIAAPVKLGRLTAGRAPSLDHREIFSKNRPPALDIFFCSDIIICKFWNPAASGVFLFLPASSPTNGWRENLCPSPWPLTPCYQPGPTRRSRDATSQGWPANGFIDGQVGITTIIRLMPVWSESFLGEEPAGKKKSPSHLPIAALSSM